MVLGLFTCLASYIRGENFCSLQGWYSKDCESGYYEGCKDIFPGLFFLLQHKMIVKFSRSLYFFKFGIAHFCTTTKLCYPDALLIEHSHHVPMKEENKCYAPMHPIGDFNFLCLQVYAITVSLRILKFEISMLKSNRN